MNKKIIRDFLYRIAEIIQYFREIVKTKEELKMALTEDAKLKWTETLIELELMGEHDSIEAHTAGDYWEFMSGQKRGNFFFTNEKFIFVSGLGFSNFSIFKESNGSCRYRRWNPHEHPRMQYCIQ